LVEIHRKKGGEVDLRAFAQKRKIRRGIRGKKGKNGKDLYALTNISISFRR